jgi:hypothetical protein
MKSLKCQRQTITFTNRLRGSEANVPAVPIVPNIPNVEFPANALLHSLDASHFPVLIVERIKGRRAKKQRNEGITNADH